MGVDSKLLISARYNVKDVIKVLKGLGVTNIEEDHKGDHSFLRFEVPGHEYKRQLYVAFSTEYGGLESTLLRYRSNPEGIELLRKIAAVTGGFLNENDYNSDFEMIQSPHDGNVNFILKHTILTKAITRDEELADKVAKAVGYE
jgi:hypothetical protein